ncbi:MAG: Long-chain fatty acid transport protein [Labilithrix sp.]|nr:Long-chain fatty acid transport protein [Labilithrix sp.]
MARVGLGGACVFSLAVLCAGTARAGGFDIPDNGAQALGRGAAFVAKADDPTAIYWNPAGLARQRGTTLYGGANLYLHAYELQRSGVFPDDATSTATPWGDQGYPVVHNAGGPYVSPFLAATTDFGTFDRLTFALGVFTPPNVGNRTFPVATGGAPAASRYDFVQSQSTTYMPTGALGVRVTPWLDLGVSGHLVLAKLEQTSVSYVDQGPDVCPNVEYQPCDSRTTLSATAASFGATFGVLARPAPSIGLGLSVRTPINLAGKGTFTPTAPRAGEAELHAGNATYDTKLPLLVKAGVRYVSLDHDFEVYDLELDGTFEGWGAAQGEGPRIRVPKLGSVENIDTLIVHGYSNTFGVRAGGAYNFDLGAGVFTLRAGGYFDSAATDFAYTRIDVDTLSKIAGAFGLGYRRGAFAVDVGYAAVASIPRVVGTDQGDVRPVDLTRGGKPQDSTGKLLPAVNEGAYRGFTNILSLGVTVTFDELFGKLRPIRYGNPYERGFVPEGQAPPEEKKPEAKKPAEEQRLADPPSAPAPAVEKRHEWWEDPAD